MSIKFTTVPPKSLYQSILSTDVTFKLANIVGFSGSDLTASDFGTEGYGVILNSSNTVMELFSWDPTTIASSSISFVDRGLPFIGSGASVTAYKLDWPAGSKVLLGSDTPQFIQWLKDYIDGIAIAGSPDASTTAKGLVEEATQAEVDAGTAAGGTAARLFINPSTHRGRQFNDYAVDSVGSDSYAITITPAITAYAAGQRFSFKAGTANTGACTLNVSGLGAKTIKKNVSDDLATGDILANQIVEVMYDGTNMQLVSVKPLNISNPTIQTFTTASTTYGDSTSRFDITNPGGSTFRYTWDGTGTDPGITAITFPTGIRVLISSNTTAGNIAFVNTGNFIVTGSGSNYFEVTNASGSSENDKIIGTNGSLKTITAQTWTKPTGLKYVVVEGVGAGGGGGGTNSDGNYGNGGGGGGYFRKIIAAGALGATESVYVGPGGIGGSGDANGFVGSNSYFTNSYIAFGGLGGGNSSITATIAYGGTATGGDLNTEGADGATGGGASTVFNPVGGQGGSSYFGGGGAGGEEIAGTNGNNYGGGGGGAGNPSSSTTLTGGNGAGGLIIVNEFY